MRAHTCLGGETLRVCTGPPLRSAADIDALRRLILRTHPSARRDAVKTVHTMQCSNGAALYPAESARRVPHLSVGRAVRVRRGDGRWWVDDINRSMDIRLTRLAAFLVGFVGAWEQSGTTRANVLSQ